MPTKEPITARISPDLARQIKSRTDQGESKTEIIENALKIYFEAGGCDTAQTIHVSQESIELIRDVIRQEIGEALGHDKHVTQETTDRPGRNTNVIRANDTNVIHGGDVPESPKIAEAQTLVWKVQKFIKAGHGVKDACRLSGCSDKRYYNKLKILKEHSNA